VPDTPEPDASNPNDLAPEDGSTGGKEGGGLSPELKDLTGKAIDYYDSALSENTRRAYQWGWQDFTEFCEEHGFEAAPATEQAVVLYLSGRAEDLAPSTLSQRMAAIQHAHDERVLSSPTWSKSVQNVMRGIRRESERSPEQAPPLLTEHVKQMVDALPGQGNRPSVEGAPDAAIQAQSRHENDRAFREYVRPQKLLENTSSAHLGL